MRYLRVLAAVAALGLGGCASIVSTAAPTAGDEGLTYHLPLKSFIATVVVTADDNGGTREQLSMGTSAAYPDLSRPFSLAYGNFPLGSRTGKLGVSANGLLTSATGTATSNVTDAAAALAGTRAFAFNSAAEKGKSSSGCPPGTHSAVVAPGTETPLCSFKIKVLRIGAASVAPATARPAGVQHAGIFYRQEEPYLMTAIGLQDSKAAAVVFAPNDSPVRFLPVSRTFFSNATATFTFSDGVPVTFDEQKDSEILALLKLPATVIGAYFEAAGKIFDAFKRRDESETAALKSDLALQAARQKYRACLAAVASQDETLLAKLGCAD